MSGYVVRDPARKPSNWRAQRSLDEELVAQGVVGISGVDTRALTRHLRERGAMRVGIFSGNAIADEGTLLAKVAAPDDRRRPLAEVATKEAYVVPAIGTKKFTVAAVDLGIKGMTPRTDGGAWHRGACAARDGHFGGGVRGPAGWCVLLQRSR
ncbi:Carbamoyl-phosphate synthase small chain [Streptomyces cyaneofuscatus]